MVTPESDFKIVSVTFLVVLENKANINYSSLIGWVLPSPLFSSLKLLIHCQAIDFLIQTKPQETFI